MKIDTLKKIKDKSTIRVIDLDELEMNDSQHSPADTVPNYVFAQAIVNPFINPEKVKEFGNNIVDLLKGTRNYNSLGYNGVTPVKVFVMDYAFACYVMTMDAAIQMTKLVAYNDSTIMRYLVKAKFGLDDTALNNIVNNRAEFESVIASATKKIKSGLLRIGHVEDIIEKYLYDFRFDDSAQYTTKVGYRVCFRMMYSSSDSDMINTVLYKLFGTAKCTGFNAGFAHSIASNGNDFNNIAKLSPAEWLKKIEDAVEAIFSNTEYHAFRTDFMNLYLKESLWDLKLSKIKSYFNESESAVFMNESYLPAICTKDITFDAGKKWIFLEKAYDDSMLYWTVEDFIAGNRATLQADIEFDSNVTEAWIPYQNGGYEEKYFDATTPVTVLAKRDKIFNIPKAACAKDAELQLMASDMPGQVSLSGSGGWVRAELGYETIIGYDYIWSNHYKNGSVAFTNTKTTYTAPLGFEVYGSQVEIANEMSAFVNVTGLPAIFRLYHKGSEEYVVDSIQEKFDLYNITPAAVYQAQKAFQHAIISTKLKVADNVKAENFAELLDLVTD